MAWQAPLLHLLAAAAVLVASSTTAAAAELVVHGRTADAAGWMHSGPSPCGGTVEECLREYEAVGSGGGGLGLRRRLYVDDDGDHPASQYISYSALTRDSVPCSVPGASYYNCQPGADANPYTRGCSAITQCRG